MNNDYIVHVKISIAVDIGIYNLEWEEIDEIDGTSLDGGSFEVISQENMLPILLKVQKPRILDENYKSGYELAILDPRQNSLETYFSCLDDYRLHREISIDSVSHLLLRTKEDGYLVCEFVIPNYTNIASTQEIDPQTTTPLLFPNPTSGTVSLSRSFEEVWVYNNLGQIMFTRNNTNFINLSDHNSGIYFIRLKLDAYSITTVRVMKL